LDLTEAIYIDQERKREGGYQQHGDHNANDLQGGFHDDSS
jgi:hypothetical protein